MVNAQQARTQVAELLKVRFPTSPVSRVDVQESVDSHGQPSLDVWVVFRSRPAREEMRYAKPRVIDELRSWLSKNADERFPYVTFVSEREDRELQHSVS